MTTALITGATQGLGLALALQLAARLEPSDVVYLTGRDDDRTRTAAAGHPNVRAATMDVTDAGAVSALARRIADEHGGIDLVVNNAVMRLDPEDDPRAVVREYVEVNNLGTTRVMRAFTPLLRPGGTFVVVASSVGTLAHLAPVLHPVFRDLDDLDAVDRAVTSWCQEVESGASRASAWPAFLNIPSKIGQVAAVRTLAAQRDDVLVTAVCPGMVNTPTSAAFWDVSTAPTPQEAAAPLVDLLLGPPDRRLHGQLSRAGTVLPFG